MSVRIDKSKALQIITQKVSRRLDAAAIYVTNDVKRSFGNSGATGKRSGATKKDRRNNRSKPWGPPNVDTGHLKKNIGYSAPSAFVRWVGTGIGGKLSVGYAMYLEYGTLRMLPRPFLRPAIYRCRQAVMRILQTGVTK